MKTSLGAQVFLAALFLQAIGDGFGQKRRSSPATASQVVDFDCPEEFGYYAHPTDCTQYYVCVFGGALLESCTGGLMYSHELQTCDWPRNVGCGEGGGESQQATVVQSPQPSRSSRPSIPSRIQQQQPREQQPLPKVITKHDLYTEEELGPAEEIETDRQQRVYRGQPPTIGQVASDRDAISTHSNAIPVPSGGRDKLSVVSYGSQQQYNRASVSPQQAYIEQVTATPTRTYNSSQYIAQQYDPYYNLYDEETDLYKDIDYSQYTTNQGSQGQRYRTPVTYKERKQPTVEIVQQEPVQRTPTYTKSKFNSQQDLYQPVVSQDEYESYSIQSNDENQYNRQPVQTKTSNRLAPVRGTEGSPGSKEALPEGVQRNGTLGTQRITLKARFSHSTARPLPSSPPPSTTDTSPTTTQSSSNDISHDSTSRPVKISESLPKAEKLIRPREPFVIQVSTPRTEANIEASRKATYELIKMFLDQGLQAESPRPFSPARSQKDNEELRESQISGRGHFIVPTPSRSKFDNIDRSQNEDNNNNDNEEAGNQRSSNVLPQRIVDRERSNFYRQKTLKQSGPQVSRGKTQVVEEYSISSLPSRLSVEPDYFSYNSATPQRRILPSREKSSSNAVDYTTTRRAPTTTSGTTTTTTTTEQIVQSTLRPEVTKEVLRKPLPPTSESIETQRNTRRRISPSRGSQRNSNPFRIVVDVKDDRESEITESKAAYQDTSYNPDTYRNDYDNAKPTKVYLRPTTTTAAPQPTYSRKDFDTYPKTLDSTTDSAPASRPPPRSDNDKRSFDSFPPNVQCTSNCNDKQTIRVRPTTYDIQTTPGITRGNSRHRGSLTYTVSPNEAEPSSRGTPASARGRPTLKPSTAIVSKAAEFVDIYRYPPSRPEPVYPTPQADKTAAKCRKDVCLLPDCYCGGKDIPGDLPVEETPQIVLLTFDDSVNDLNKGLYSDLFEKGRTNPNGCPISATFYVSHEWTDYSQVQNLYAGGHEIASHSVSHSFGEQFSQKKWTREIAGQREILAAYGGVKLEDIRGMRAPFLAVGGNKMFKMLHDSNFTYDSSMPVYENKPPSWPYTMDYKIFHDCMIPPCPSRSYPGVWEVPMVMWQDLNGGRCSMGDACSNPPTADGVYKMLIKNFERHFTSNRAPFGLFYHAAWFTQPHHKEGFIAFLDTIVNMPEVWLVTNWQAIQWVRDPTPISRLNNFAPFQCNYPDRPKKCNNPKVCNLWHKSGVRYMRTCQTCPEVYPWTGKTGVRNSRVDNEVFQE